MESEQITATTVTPKHITLPLGDTQLFTVTAVNQFGIAEIETTEYYEATTLGDHQLIVSLGGFTDTAYIHVVNFAELNLALGKPTYASGYENAGTAPENATDGLLDTRWSSRFQDGEWITIDLGKEYGINRVKLYWEAAYATHFDIQTSLNGIEFTTVYSDANSNGNTQDILIPDAPIQARYVRILCHKRYTVYGSSLYEIEIYGVNLPTDTPSLENNSTKHNYKYILRNGKIYIVHSGQIYTTLGQHVK
jgi:hypothetical protein